MAAQNRPNRSGTFFLLVVGWLVVSAAAQVWRRSTEPERPVRTPQRRLRELEGRRRPGLGPAERPAAPASVPSIELQPRPGRAPAPSLAPATITLPGRRRTLSAPATVAMVAIVLGMAALLNADVLLAEAEQKPFGDDRDFWVATWEPLANASDALYLNRPRRWLDEALGHDPHIRATDAVPVFASSPVLTPTPVPSSTASVMATETPAIAVTPGPTSTPLPTPTPAPPPKLLRAPTADAPLRLWVGGDSISGVYGQSLVRIATDLGYYSTELDYRVSSGLTRVDYFDWPTHLAEEASRLKPDVFVVMFGANDTQGIVGQDGRIYQALSDGWKVEYRRRVAGMMDLLYAPDRLVVWAGQPIMESVAFSAQVAQLNAIYSEEAAKRPWVTYFDTWSLLVDSAGQYAYSLPDANGNAQGLRAPDGIHLSRAGGDRLAAATIERISAEIRK